MVGCCSASRFEFPQNPSPAKHFCECVAGIEDTHLDRLSLLQENLTAPTDLPHLKAEACNPNGNNGNSAIHTREVYNTAGNETSNMHDFNCSNSDNQPADMLKFEYKVYGVGGVPDLQTRHWQYHKLNPSMNCSLAANHETGNCESGTRFIVSSLEDEFYVDAGIQIPQQLTSSDFTPLPSRIPNVREILFRNKSTSISTNSQNISQSVLQMEVKTEHKASPESGNFSLEPKPNFSEAHKIVTKASSMSAASKTSVSLNIMTKKTSIPSNVSKRNSGVFGGKVDCQAQQTSRGKLSCANKQKAAGNVTATNRRHSYMEGDKAVTIKSGDIAEEKKDSSMPENRRHSYLDRLQASASDGAAKCNETFTVKKLNTQGQNLSQPKLSVATVTNRRHSYNSVVQSNRGDADVLMIKRGAASNRHSIGPETRKSAFNSQTQIKRGTSLDRETGTDAAVIGSTVKVRSVITPSAVKHTVRRHSSLEIDDMDRLTVQGRVQGKRVENKFLSTSVQKELICTSADGKTVNKMIDISKAECRRSTQRELQSLDDVGPTSKGNHSSKIPRGGGTSCHSSPGNSRASSPTVLVCGSSSRLRQRTAPNSRASSPTGLDKLQQRLSLGSLNCYMSNMKLAEPGTSRLPVR
jgi:hypothetical protein